MNTTTTIEGEYYLQGVREMASGFLLKPDNTFQFFFSYGALDRYGSGTWKVNGKHVILNSAARPEHDFKLIESKKVPADSITVRITDNNPVLQRYVYASLQKGVEGSWLPASEKGEVEFSKQKVETISLIFEFCPERFSTFVIKDKDHNDFTFHFEQWIVEAFLMDFSLEITDEGLFGKHPLLEGEEYNYQKTR